jgi:DNA ligase (NAD+)
MPLSVFGRYHEQFANPRNLAAGALKQKDPAKTKEYQLKFFAYELLGDTSEHESQRLAKLQEWGFTPVETLLVAPDREDMYRAYEHFLAKRGRCDFEVDGVVYKASGLEVQTRLGASAHHPRWAIAFKFQGDSGTTILREVEWSVSRTGTITPIGIIDPIPLSGATVSRVSLHNYGLIKKLGVTLGAQVTVMRRGGVIPHLESVLSPSDREVPIPERCPSCGFPTEVREDFLYCSNPQACRQTKLGELKHFVDVLEIEGFGDKLIEQLYDAGFVEEVYDFFTLRLDDLLSLERVGEILARKLLGQVQAKSEVPLEIFLRSLGIPEVGKHVSQILVKQYRNLESIFRANEEALATIPTVGPVIAAEVVRGLREKQAIIQRLLTHITLSEKTSAKAGTLSGKSFLFTGKLATMDRGAAEKKVQEEGGEIAAGVSRDLDYLVIGSEGYKNREKGNKWIKAEALIQKGAKLKIISEEEFFKMLGGEE